jgi:hypothetical protein
MSPRYHSRGLVPVCLVVMKDLRSGWPAVHFGAGEHLIPGKGLPSSLLVSYRRARRTVGVCMVVNVDSPILFLGQVSRHGLRTSHMHLTQTIVQICKHTTTSLRTESQLVARNVAPGVPVHDTKEERAGAGAVYSTY